VVIRQFTQDCLAIEADWTSTVQGVTLTLQCLPTVRGAPRHI